ncbi:hypothetical protein LCGC14_1004710 [marine sediment metagenome]|uniref:Uncharacterized protein n=1 Tax=marine sediment metagenome TaxID=412755 RepID=A0A0F9N237_9ZZZZ|nr:hypothetical protein [archaeon]
MSEGQINVKDFITLSTVMIGAVLTILALIWQVPPVSGIGTVTFLLMLSFILFVNSVSANSKAKYEVNLGKADEKYIHRFVSFAEYTFGLGFTLVIAGFTILGYKYLLGSGIGRNIGTLMLPIIFLLTAWILIFIYNTINYSGALSAIKSMKRNIWILLEALVLVVILFDFFEVITIP